MGIMVPRTRLLQWFALIYLPSAALAALVPTATPVSAGLVIGLVVAVLADAVLSRSRVNRILIHVPDSMRMSVGRSETLTVQVLTLRLR